jgi:hypothetical protein
MAGVPYVFASATTSIPLSELDVNFNTPVTIGNTTVGLGNTVTSFGNVTLTNTTITVGSSTTDLTVHGLTVGLGAGSDTYSTVVGYQGLSGSNTGSNNNAFGYQTLLANTSGTRNSAFGRASLTANTSGADNTAYGHASLSSTTIGSSNTGVGSGALQSNTTSSNNTAVGYQAGYSNSTGGGNTFLGYQSGYTFSGGSGNTYYNTCVGAGSGYALGSGVYANTLIGANAGNAITGGLSNTIIGSYSGNQGGLDIRTSNNYIVLSDGAGNPRGYFNSTGDWVVTVGDINCYGAYLNTTANAANLNVASDGYFRRSTSALKYKTNVRDLPTIDITKFRPVVYNSNCEGDDKTVDHFGFIADEVDQAGYKQLVSYGAQGEVEGFQYERMTAVLTQQVQQLLATVNSQATEIAALKAKVGA